jgi:hypothetical protein
MEHVSRSSWRVIDHSLGLCDWQWGDICCKHILDLRASCCGLELGHLHFEQVFPSFTTALYVFDMRLPRRCSSDRIGEHTNCPSLPKATSETLIILAQSSQ